MTEQYKPGYDANPRPWSITQKPLRIVDAKGSVVANLTTLDLPNAELIVQAVNAFTETSPRLSALAEALSHMLTLQDRMMQECNLGASCLSANTIQQMNEFPVAARRLLEQPSGVQA